ncbi:hypothetical protein BDM02DRAFT_3129931 [Thelephora ganbajun]|uniref:Uncharacterized protein n=1 Tax=Thelephora ganbajun TaxID=370292 RepID=A0ACB6ZC48_THEGA|nr:hypothetical protein BDM02DRAFT_3129931 [Thelephora ganbajun]
MPSANGINGSRTAGNPSATKLVVGTNTGPGPSSTQGPDFAPGTSLVVTSTSTISEVPSQTPSESPAPSTAKQMIPLSAVIGICIGAFVGASLLICLSVWFYRRSSRRPPPRERQKQPLAQSHGVTPTTPWTRFDDDEDKWESRNEMSEKGPADFDLPPEAERTASPRSTGRSPATDDHFGSQHDVASKSVPFSHYHPKLAEQMALEPPRPVGADNQSKAASLDGSTAGTFLSLGTVHIESGKMSPTFTMAKMTPPATASRLHRWESAEVIDPDAHAQEVEIHHDPFSEKSTPTTYSPTETFDDRRSFRNPFFNAHPGVHSRHPSIIRKSSTISVSSDPFKDEEEMVPMPRPRFISHATHDSSSSGGSLGNEKSMQSLIAALDLPQEVIEERLRIASMHPSEVSRYSTATISPTGYTIPIPETAEQGYVV